VFMGDGVGGCASGRDHDMWSIGIDMGSVGPAVGVIWIRDHCAVIWDARILVTSGNNK
jgi:hypothetical protein